MVGGMTVSNSILYHTYYTVIRCMKIQFLVTIEECMGDPHLNNTRKCSEAEKLPKTFLSFRFRRPTYSNQNFFLTNHEADFDSLGRDTMSSYSKETKAAVFRAATQAVLQQF